MRISVDTNHTTHWVFLCHEAEVPIVVHRCSAVGELCIHDTTCLLSSFTKALGAFCPQVVFGVADGTLHDSAIAAPWSSGRSLCPKPIALE